MKNNCLCFLLLLTVSLFANGQIIKDVQQENGSRLVQCKFERFAKFRSDLSELRAGYDISLLARITEEDTVLLFTVKVPAEEHLHLDEGTPFLIKLDNGENITFPLARIEYTEWTLEVPGFIRRKIHGVDSYPEYVIQVEDMERLKNHKVIKARMPISWDNGYVEFDLNNSKLKYIKFSEIIFKQYQTLSNAIKKSNSILDDF